MSTELAKQDKQLDMFIFAKNSVEMAKAQEQTIRGMEAKLALEETRKKDLETNLELAKKNKWRTETLKRHVGYAQNKVEFYEKILEALRAGYQIVPDMDVEVFAIRTSKKKPRENRESGAKNSWGGPSVSDQKTDYSPTGEGEYVSPNRGTIQEEPWEGKDGEGKPRAMLTRYWTEFDSPEFPFQLVKPAILEMTGDAMKRKIFDEMGILPKSRGADPIVVGKICMKPQSQYQRKSVSFMVAWFVDLEDI
jgi:hypothetical protein